MKRVLSVMLTLMLAFTMLSGITAFASDEYDVVTTLVNEDYSTTMAKYTATTGWSEFRKTGATGRRVEFRSPFAATAEIVDPSTIDSTIAAGVTSAKVFKAPVTGTSPFFRLRNIFSATADDMVRIKFRIYLDGSSNPAVTSFNAYFQMQNTTTGSTGATFVQNNLTIPVGEWYDVTVIEKEDAAHGGIKVTLQDTTGNSAYPTTVYLDGNVVIETVKVAESDASKVAADKAALDLGDTSAVSKNLTLPTTGDNGSQITWATSDASVIETDGTIHQDDEAKTATLTATLTLGNVSDTKTFDVTVAAVPAITLAECFKSNMVIQRNMPIDVWGTSTKAGRTVTVTLGENTATTTTDSTGEWKVTLPAMSAETGLKLVVTCNDAAQTSKSVSGIAIGEVIMAAGQSNMNWTLANIPNYQELVPDSEILSRVRVLNFLDSGSHNYSWMLSSKSNYTSRTGIGIIVGYNIAAEENITVGVIDVAIGGAQIESFLSPETLDSRSMYDIYTLASDSETDMAKRKKQPAGLYNSWFQYIKGIKIGSALWYQGENNANQTIDKTSDIYYYKQLDLFNQWREEYNNPNMPIAVVQLAPYSGTNYDYVKIRQHQLDITNDMDNVYLVTTADVGPTETDDQIHPTNKGPVAARATNILRYALLGKNVAYSSPLYKSMTVEGNTATLTFGFADGYTANGSAGALKTSDGKAVTGFEVAGKDGVFYDATAIINGNQIIVSSENVANPVEVRYCYVMQSETDSTTLGGNVVNAADIPMGPFKAQLPNVAIDSVTGSGYTYTVNLSNSAYNVAPGFVVAALYDGEEFIQMKTVQFSIDERKSAAKTVTFNPATALSDPKVKIMAWKSMTTIVPYCAAVDR